MENFLCWTNWHFQLLATVLLLFHFQVGHIPTDIPNLLPTVLLYPTPFLLALARFSSESCLFENFLVSYSGAHLGVILNTSLTLSNILPSEFVKKCWIGLSNKRVLSAEDKISRVWQLSLYDAPLFTATFLTSRINCHRNSFYFRTVRVYLCSPVRCWILGLRIVISLLCRR